VHGLPVLRLGPFVLHPRLESPPVPGWLVIAPLRHVEQWDALDPAELRELGPLVARVSSALRAETPTAKVYVSVFAEVLPHVHVHVVARPPDLPAEERGPRLFLSAGRVPEAEVQALARRVYARLGSGDAGRGRPSKSPSPWAPALLSALLFPGAGQFRNGRWGKGVAFTVATAALLARIAWRVWAEALDALLAAQAPLDLFEMWALAEEIRRRNAAEFSVLTLVLVGLWAISILDAWRDASPRR
jgi:diadenosine tetraphosphate (Ap4A) HIT family hydrolase